MVSQKLLTAAFTLMLALLPARAPAQQAAPAQVTLSAPSAELCNQRAVLQRFPEVEGAMCVVGVVSPASAEIAVLLDGEEALVRLDEAGGGRFVGYVRVGGARDVLIVVREPGAGDATHEYVLEAVGEAWAMRRKDLPVLGAAAAGDPLVQAAGQAEEAAEVQTPAGSDAADVARYGSIIILEPVEWMGEGTRSVEIAPGDSLRVRGRVHHPAGVARATVNEREIALQPHPSGSMEFIAFVRAEDLAQGLEVLAYPTEGDPLRKLVGVDPALAEAAAPQAAASTGPTHYLEILEPSVWAGSEGTSVRSPARRSVRVVGEAMHAGGVRAVMIDNARAGLQQQPNGAVRFVGYVPVGTDPRTVEIRVDGRTGQPIRQRYSLTPDPASLASFTPETALASTGFKGERWAVVVGVSEYQDPDLVPLRYAHRDAQAFYDFLRSERAGGGGFKEENVVLLLNEQATYRAVRSALFTFLQNSTEEDQVVIYFAGHGAPDPNRPDDLYLLTSDTRRGDLAATGFPMYEVQNAMQKVRARDVLVITDACHSGGVGATLGMRNLETNMINDIFLNQLNSSSGGIVSFTASMANQVSAEGEEWGGGHGVFTHYLLEALYGAGDEDGDRIVTLVEMMEWTRDRVRRETMNAQIPHISTTSYDQLWPMSIVVDGSSASYTSVAASRPGRQAQRPAAVAGAGSRSADRSDELARARETVQLYPTSARYWGELAELLEELGETDEAIQAFQQAASLEPASAARRYSLAVALRDAEKPTPARVAFEEAVRLDARNAEYRNGLGGVLIQLGETGPAIEEHRRAVRLEPTSGKYHRDLADAYSRHGKTGDAISEYEEAIRLSPSQATYHHEFAQVLRLAGRDMEGIGSLQAAARLDYQNAAYHRDLAMALRQAGRVQEAIEAYQQAAELEPEDAALRYELGLLFRGISMQYETVEALREAVRLEPDNAVYRFHLGEALRSSAKPEESLPEFEVALEASPDSARYHHGYALALHLVGQPTEAMDAMRTALRLEPGSGPYHFDMARLLQEAGLLDEAIAEVEQARQIDKRNGDYKRLLQDLQRLKKARDRQR